MMTRAYIDFVCMSHVYKQNTDFEIFILNVDSCYTYVVVYTLMNYDHAHRITTQQTQIVILKCISASNN